MKSHGIDLRRARAVVPWVVLFATFGCMPAGGGGAAQTKREMAAIPVALGADGELDPELEPLPEAGLAHLEDKVREDMVRRRKELEALVATGDTPAAELARVYGVTGMAYDQNGIRPPALACYRNAERLDPGNKAWPFYQGQIHHLHLGDLVAAETAYGRCLKKDPYFPWAHVELARVERERDRLDAAAAHAERALILDPKFGPALDMLGRILADQERYEDAVKQFRKALDLYPEATALHYPLGIALIHLGKEKEGEAYLDKHGRQSVPQVNPLIARRIDTIAGWRQHQLNGTSLVQRGSLAAGIQQFRKALSKCRPDDPDRHLILANLGANEVLYANQLRKNGNPGEYKGWILSAFMHILEALKSEPRNQRANFNMGTIWARHLGDDERAIPYYKRSLAEFPDQREAHLNLALALWRLDRIDEALAEASAVIQLFPADVDARRTKARLLIRKQDWQAAYPYLEESCKVLPADRDMAHTRARVLITTGSGEQVSQGIQVLTSLAPEQDLARLSSADEIVTRALAQMRLGQFEAARVDLARCRDAGRQHAKVDLVEEAEAYIQACDRKQAVEKPWPAKCARLSPPGPETLFTPAVREKFATQAAGI